MHKNLCASVVKGFDVSNKKWFPLCLCGEYAINKRKVSSVHTVSLW